MNDTGIPVKRHMAVSCIRGIVLLTIFNRVLSSNNDLGFWYLVSAKIELEDGPITSSANKHYLDVNYFSIL